MRCPFSFRTCSRTAEASWKSISAACTTRCGQIPTGSRGSRRSPTKQKSAFTWRSRRPGAKLNIDEYYAYIFERSVPGLPEKAAADGVTPLDYMRRSGAFELKQHVGPIHEEPIPPGELVDLNVDRLGRAFARSPKPDAPNIVPVPTPDGDQEGRRRVGVEIDGVVRRGFPTPSGRLEFYSSTLVQWGWPEMAIPAYVRSHVHPQS